MENQGSSGVNTVLIILILVIVVGFIVWIVGDKGTKNVPAPREDENSLNIDVDLPDYKSDEKPTEEN